MTSANFLLDSESSLKAALSAMSSAERRRRLRRPGPGHDQHLHEAAAMIKGIIRFSADNRFLVLLATAVAVAYGVYTLRHIPVDAIPDLSDTQVIVYSRWDRSPDIIEDQVTYPIVTALLGAPQRQGHPRLLRLRLLATSTSSSRTAPTSTGRAAACSSTCPRSSRCCRRA